MIAQAIMALLQHASEIDRATVDLASSVVRPSITSSRVSGGSQFPRDGAVGGIQVLPSLLWPPYQRPSFCGRGKCAVTVMFEGPITILKRANGPVSNLALPLCRVPAARPKILRSTKLLRG
jgi:hypothetical protein